MTLVRTLNALAGEHGVGRIDSVEDRLVGIKSREVYEAPAGITLLAAHEALESLTLSKEQRRLKGRIAQEYADLVYNGLWFSAHHQDLAGLHREHAAARNRHGPHEAAQGRGHGGRPKVSRSLYDFSLATYDKADQFDRTAAVGFISIWGLPVKVQAQAQLLDESERP